MGLILLFSCASVGLFGTWAGLGLPSLFVLYNKKLESILQLALAEGRVTPELSAILNDQRNRISHLMEEVLVLVVAALMVLKPF